MDLESKSISYEVRIGGTAVEGTVSRQGAKCVATGSAMPLTYIRQQGKDGGLGRTLIAVVAEGPGGRVYAAPRSSSQEVIGDLNFDLGPLPNNPRDFKTPNYGMTNWQDLFTTRQLITLTGGVPAVV